MNTQLLQSVKQSIIESANKNGTLLSDEFASPEEFSLFVTSMTIQMVMQTIGCSIDKAYEIVFGEGSWENMTQQVQDALKNK